MTRAILFLLIVVSPAIAQDEGAFVIPADVARAMYQQLRDQQELIGDLSDLAVEQQRRINRLQASNNCV